MQLADPPDRDGTAAVRDSAAHRLEELKEPRVALTAQTYSRVDALDGDGAAEHRRRAGGIRRGRYVSWDPSVSRANFAVLDRDHVALPGDLHSALPEQREREVDERRGDERAHDMHL